jgi:hypothetical protein
MARRAYFAVALAFWLSTSFAQAVLDTEQEADARVIENLKAAGSDLSKPHPTDYYLYFGVERNARSAATEMGSQGFVIKAVRPSTNNQWLVLASKPIVPSLAVVSEIARELHALAQRNSGEYDGWEAEVTK